MTFWFWRQATGVGIDSIQFNSVLYFNSHRAIQFLLFFNLSMSLIFYKKMTTYVSNQMSHENFYEIKPKISCQHLYSSALSELIFFLFIFFLLWEKDELEKVFFNLYSKSASLFFSCSTSWVLTTNGSKRYRAGHFRYFFHFFNNKKWFFCTFYKVNNLFLHQSYLKSPLPIKLTWWKMQNIIFI